MLPEITELQINTEDVTETSTTGKSFLFDFSTGEFVLNDGKLVLIEDKDNLKQWIEATLRTEKDRYNILKGIDYGVELEDLIIGNNYPTEFIKSEAQREITEALLKHPNINSVSDFTFEKNENKLTVKFVVNHDFEQEVNI
jgi:hypothetical protein